MPGLALFTVPFLSSLSIIRTTTPALDLLTSCVPACVCWWVWLIRPTLCNVHTSTDVTGVATMQIKVTFLSSISSACLNVWHWVATSFSCRYVLFLCFCAFIVVVVKNKKWSDRLLLTDIFNTVPVPNILVEFVWVETWLHVMVLMIFQSVTQKEDVFWKIGLKKLVWFQIWFDSSKKVPSFFPCFILFDYQQE